MSRDGSDRPGGRGLPQEPSILTLFRGSVDEWSFLDQELSKQPHSQLFEGFEKLAPVEKPAEVFGLVARAPRSLEYHEGRCVPDDREARDVEIGARHPRELCCD